MGILNVDLLPVGYGRRGSAGSRCAFRPQRARRRKQEALAVAYVVVQQVNHRALALDPLGDEVDAETTEQVGEVGWVDVRGRALLGIEQPRRRSHEETHTAVGEVTGLEAQIPDMVD